MKKLFNSTLENISKDIFKKYPDVISEMIGEKHGVYALYNRGKLCYVGKAIDLKRRVTQQLSRRRWSHFSLFLTKKSMYIDDIEPFLIAISKPKGNKVKPKLEIRKLNRELEQKIKIKQYNERKKFFGQKSKKLSLKIHQKISKSKMINPFGKRKRIFAKYKGKEYRANFLISGKVKFKNKPYSSLTSAALIITKGIRVNGRRFWHVKDENREWVKISSFSK